MEFGAIPKAGLSWIYSKFSGFSMFEVFQNFSKFLKDLPIGPMSPQLAIEKGLQFKAELAGGATPR